MPDPVPQIADLDPFKRRWKLGLCGRRMAAFGVVTSWWWSIDAKGPNGVGYLSFIEGKSESAGDPRPMLRRMIRDHNIEVRDDAY